MCQSGTESAQFIGSWCPLQWQQAQQQCRYLRGGWVASFLTKMLSQIKTTKKTMMLVRHGFQKYIRKLNSSWKYLKHGVDACCNTPQNPTLKVTQPGPGWSTSGLPLSSPAWRTLLQKLDCGEGNLHAWRSHFTLSQGVYQFRDNHFASVSQL